MFEIVPSILAADFSNLALEITKIENQVNNLHIDVMDGHFVPNLTIGPLVIKSIRSITNLLFDVHLMIKNPLQHLDHYINSGADSITVHIESETNSNILDSIERIHSIKKKVGIALTPKTPFSELEPFLEDIDLILIMTVEPGFGGQTFLHESVQKIRNVSKIVEQSGRSIVIQVDGGINKETIPLVVNAGATSIVAGSAIFGQPDPALAIIKLRELIQE